MIPFFEQPAFRLGPISVHAFGAFFAVAMLLGHHISIRRARSHGLNAEISGEMLIWVVPFGLAGAHLYAVLAYFPHRLFEDPWLLLRFWEELSSVGGMAGGLVGIWVYLRRRRKLSTGLLWGQLDVVAFALPFGWAVGRLGCFFAHDHPGHVTTFLLGRSLESGAARTFIRQVYVTAEQGNDLPISSSLAEMAFHDLGWYEFLWLALVVAPAFLWMDRKTRPPRFWVAAFLLLYSPMRFGLDFLRIADPRYVGLTPAQFAALGGLVAGLWLWSRARSEPQP